MLETYTWLAVPDCCGAAAAAGMTEDQVIAWIFGTVAPPFHPDDYERFIEDVRAQHTPAVQCGCSQLNVT